MFPCGLNIFFEPQRNIESDGKLKLFIGAFVTKYKHSFTLLKILNFLAPENSILFKNLYALGVFRQN